MNIDDYLELYYSKIESLVSTNPTDFTVSSIKEATKEIISLLKPYRLDNHRTRDLLSLTLEKYQKAVKTPDGEISHYEETVNSIVLSQLLLMYCKREVSFHYAYTLLQQYNNGRTGFADDLMYRTEQEIETAVLQELSIANPNKNLCESFLDLLMHKDKIKLLTELHKLLDFKKGKDVVIVVKALEKLQLLNTYSSLNYLHTLLTKEFNNIGGVRNFTNYMNETNNCVIQDHEINKIVNILQTI